MYRTNRLRLTKSTGQIPELSDKKIHRLSSEKRVDINSRIEILQTLAGYRWVGESSHVTSQSQPSPTEEQTIALTLLDDMEIASQFDWIERTGKYYSWIQFAINQPMLDMFADKEHPFNIIEEGAVYGYPISSTLAFAGVIPKKLVRQKNAAEHYLYGVNSEKYYRQEVEYAEKMWRHLCQIAPKLTTEGYEEYKRFTKKIATPPHKRQIAKMGR